jgi:hypothetical protein
VGYCVAGQETIVKERLPTEQQFARHSVHRLVLITCGGPWPPELAKDRDSVVVVAEQGP